MTSLLTKERKRILHLYVNAFIGTALLCIPQIRSETASGQPVYSSKTYGVWSDHVTEGSYTARAVSRTEIVSNYPVDTAPVAERRWSLDENISSYPQLHSDFLLGDALYNLSLAELRKDQRADGSFSAGASWEGVWTRDVSYSTLLSLAIIAPEGAKASLRQKIHRGRIVQDTGTGGSWPVSTDRVTWALAAWEIYAVTGDRAWLRESYSVIRDSVLDDEHVVLDPTTGLAHGESSFLDWREQTYPRWMQPADIYASECLGTNAVYFRTYQILAAMSRELGVDGSRWQKRANRIRKAINKSLWQGDRGYYGQYLYGRLTLSLSSRAEALGEALTVLFGIAPPSRQARLLRSQPFMPYGVPTVYPETPAVPPYHNRSAWPFVQSFWNLAAAKANDEPLLLYGLAALERESALFLTNKENFVSDTGNPKGTVINSDRQLWSVAGNLAMVYRILFGMRFEPSGLYFHPVVPRELAGTRKLSNFSYRHANLTIEVCGFGAHIRRFTLDGNRQAPIVRTSIRGEHLIAIELDNVEPTSAPLHTADDTVAPDTPHAHLLAGSLAWDNVPHASSYQLYANGSAVLTTQQTDIQLPTPSRFTEYQVAALGANHQASFLSEPQTVGIATAQISDSIHAGSLDPPDDSELNQQSPDLAFNVTIPADGRYSLAVLYSNGSGPINTDNKCAIRTLFVDHRAIGPLVLPQRGKDLWDDRGWSNRLVLSLTAGRHHFELRLLPYDTNMNGQINTARFSSVELWRIDSP